MKYEFTREKKDIRLWDETNRKIAAAMEKIRRGECSEEELKIFLMKAVKDASDIGEQDLAFWYYDDPDTMPPDARCDYVYRPTYLMTLSMVSIINRHPELMNYAGVKDTLRRALNACAGRDLRGSGYDDYQELCENMLLFLRNGIVKFMRDWPLFSIPFEDVFRNALNDIENNYRAGRNGGICKDVQQMIIRLRYDTEAIK